MMSSGKIIQFDQLLLTSCNNKSAQIMQDHAPIDRRALPLVCTLNNEEYLLLANAGNSSLKPMDTNIQAFSLANAEVQNENVKLNSIISSWNGKFRRKHATIIGGGLKGVQAAFYMCDKILGKSPKFPRVSLVRTENGP